MTTRFMHSFKKNLRQYTMLIALAVIWLVFTYLTGSLFLSPRNLSNLFLQSATIAILSIGMTLVLVAGHLDLSVGSVAGFIGAVCAVLQVNYGWSTVPTLCAGAAVGVLIGFWHGFWVAYKKIPAFIVTLASMIAFRGAILGVTQGRTIGPMNESFAQLGQGYVPSLFFRNVEHPPFNDSTVCIAIVCIALFILIQIKKRSSRLSYGFPVLSLPLETGRIALFSLAIAAFFAAMALYMGIPYAVLIVFILGVVFTILTNNTTFGRHLYAMGGNVEAAKLSGVNINKRTMGVFVLMGLLTAIAGVVLTARLNAATTSAGQNFELDAISAAIIGGTSTMGGVGTVFGSLVGALVMASLNNGMSLMDLNITWQYIVKGAVLLLAVWIDVSTRKKA